ncbi:alkyl/aryl-sulfatase [Stenotrophomonas pigmentata]|uniref:alkyl/aryl-sulfatase n=1 Tax=Stenotrophomonas pigmentata TaxID=3055080 RepID=UPI0026EDC9F8|nr:alkyl sulfatase dimerization domain-containing protein [Stenotrophomonas sp. 610A2]
MSSSGISFFGITTVLATLIAGHVSAQQIAPSLPASAATRQANQHVLTTLPFNDRRDFENAARGLLRKPDTLTITGQDGRPVWDLESYKSFITAESPAPDSVNPSLWRNSQLLLNYGLFEVTDGIYQVRGYDLANITFVRGKTGWIVFDVGSTPETATASYQLLTEQFGSHPIVAVVYSHPHLDHYGGVKGLINEQDVRSGKVRLIAPEGFMEHAVSENVTTGNAMSRRSVLMYGALLPRGPQGSVGAGLGLTNPRGVTTLIEPNEYISKTGQKLVVDGVEMEFQLTPGTEAPAEMNTYFPAQRALWMAENTTATLHNILTLRGAQVRDALGWSRYIQETIDLYGDKTDVKFQSHHHPEWGQAQVQDYFKKQRDIYKYLHDRSVHLINQGYTGDEIAELVKLPPSLDALWSGRGYYGTLKHNARAIYQRYMGWYTGNPSDLDVLPNAEAASKYVEYMGGEAAILKRAKADIDKGQYRFAAMVLRHVAFANPDSSEGKALLAAAYEQMGYQAESGPWRSVYLQGAYELRNGTPRITASSASPDVVRAMTVEMFFDYLAVRLDAEKALGKVINVNFEFTDIPEAYTLSLENSVLNHSRKLASNADAKVRLSKATLDEINLGTLSIKDAIANGRVQAQGDHKALTDLFGMFSTFSPDFNVVTP